MTNKEILKADLLDILFEKRNKDYGAYALRRGYNTRLLTSMLAALFIVLVFLYINLSGKENNSSAPLYKIDNEIKITEVKLPVEKQKEPEKPKVTIKPIEKIASVKYVSKIEIKPDDKVKETLTDIASLDGKEISDITQEGKPDDEKTKVKEHPVGTGNENTNTTVITPAQPDFIINERDPEFPGGTEALKKFLAKNLNTPSDLEDGELKTVRIRFKVDKDGSVNTFEIITSGGNAFDNEVLRVCKKMPRWIPAYQNGINVPVSYVLPVTFMGVEQ